MSPSIFDTIYEVLASPSPGLKRVTAERPLGWAVLLSILVSVVFALTLMPDLPELVRAIFRLERGRVGIELVMPVWVACFLAILFLGAGILHLVAILLGGQGSYSGLACGLSFAILPVMFFPPLALLRALLGFPGSILYLFGAVALVIWMVILMVLALRHNYAFSVGRAITSYFIPLVGLIIIPLISIAVATGL